MTANLDYKRGFSEGATDGHRAGYERGVKRGIMLTLRKIAADEDSIYQAVLKQANIRAKTKEQDRLETYMRKAQYGPITESSTIDPLKYYGIVK